YPDVNDISFHDKLKDYDNIEDSDNDNISFYDDNFSIHDESIENDNVISIEHASQEIHRLCYIGNSSYTKRRKNQQQREAAKEILKLHIFWNLDNEVKGYN
ncbi:6237_t:CDS:2, partial [Funneliformis caledonium]